MTYPDSKKYLDFILLLPALSLTVLFRLPAYVPLAWKTDELDYLIAVQSLNHNGLLYLNYGDLKPPLLFGLYQLACQIGGGIDMLYIKHLGLLFSLLTVVGIYLLTRAISGYRTAFVAATLFALYSICARGEEMLATNSELLMNAFVVFSYVAFVGYLQRSEQLRYLVLASLFLVAGFFINQKAGINLIAFFIILFEINRQRNSYIRLIKDFSVILSVFVVPILMFLGYYVAVGAIGEIYYWLWEMPGAYINTYDMSERMSRIMLRLSVFFSGYWALLPAIAMGIWAISIMKGNIKQSWELIILYLLVSFFAVMVGGKMMERYFIQLLPPFMILSAIGLTASYQYLKQWRWGKNIGVKIGFQVFLVGVLLISPLHYLQQHYATNKVTVLALQTDPQLKQLQSLVEEIGISNDSFFVFPKDPYYHYLLQRPPASRYVETETHLGKADMYPLANEFFERGWTKLFADLQGNRPEWIIDSSADFGFKKSEPQHIRNKKQELKDYILKHYRKVGVFNGDYLYQRI